MDPDFRQDVHYPVFVIDYPSPNFEERKDGKTPRLVILHGTWTKTIRETLGFLTDTNKDRPGGRVSCHYVVDVDGTVYRLVDEDKRAWHAGASAWRGETDINSASIGIELQNDGVSPYPDAQIEALAALLKDIRARRNIPPENVLGHEDVAPGRKGRSGRAFSMEPVGKSWPGRARWRIKRVGREHGRRSRLSYRACP